MIDGNFGERRYRTRLKCYTGWPELTALADILFLSLLFFALTSRFVQVSGYDIALPRVNTNTTGTLERFVVSLSLAKPGSVNIYFRGRRCSDVGELYRQLSELHYGSGSPHGASLQPSVIIRADRRIPFEEVMKVMDAAKKAQLSCFIEVKAPEANPGPQYEK